MCSAAPDDFQKAIACAARKKKSKKSVHNDLRSAFWAKIVFGDYYLQKEVNKHFIYRAIYGILKIWYVIVSQFKPICGGMENYMVRHIVMWKYNAELSMEEREALFGRLFKAAEEMNGNIAGLISAKLIENVNPQEKYDLCLYCEFESVEDIVKYQDDPVHVAFKNIISGNVFDRACIDAQ